MGFVGLMKTGCLWKLKSFGTKFQTYVSTYQRNIDKMNNIVGYNLNDTKYRQMAFQLARWHCSLALFGNPWSNKSEW